MQAWHDFLQVQEKHLGKETVDRWLRSLKVVHFDSCNLYCEAKDSFQVLWFEEHIRPLLKTQLFNNNHRPIKVHITISGEEPRKRKEKGHSPLPSLVLTPDPLEPTATFDHFVPGESNALLLRFMQELIAGQISLGAFNPIYLYGGSGMGKTHLLMALAHAFKEKGLFALYVRAETFTTHVVNAIRNSEMQPFRNHYRTADLLLVDDVHLFARRAATQEEFFHTFNALHTSGRQILLTAHSAPPLLEEIEPRLISRFEWGITLHLEKLTRLELKQVLEQRCHALAFPLEEELVHFLVETFASPASLHRALDALILRMHLEQNSSPVLDRERAEELLKELIVVEKQGALTPQKIIAQVAAFYGISSEDILGKSHTHECSLPRQVAMHLCRTQLDLPYTKIGQLFFRDHSTVMTSVKHVQSKIEQKESEMGYALAEIQRKLETSYTQTT